MNIFGPPVKKLYFDSRVTVTFKNKMRGLILWTQLSKQAGEGEYYAELVDDRHDKNSKTIHNIAMPKLGFYSLFF